MQAVQPLFIYEDVLVTVCCQGRNFTAKYKDVLQPGYTAKPVPLVEPEKNKDASLPNDLEQGMVIPVVRAEKKQGFTSPPKVYTEDTLLSAMETAGNKEFEKDTEKKGLGTPATRAAILEKLVSSGYVQRKGKQMIPTEDGVAAIRNIPDYLKSASMTAEWENDLLRMERGEIKPHDFMQGIHGLIDKMLADLRQIPTVAAASYYNKVNQTLYYTKKIAETENWNLQDIYSDEGKSGTSLRKRDAFKRMMRDAKDQKMDLIICASISRFARNFSDCMTQIAALKTMHPAHPIGVYFETENIYTLNPSSQYSLDIQALLADWESGNKSRRMILSYDQRIMTGQYPVADLMGYRHTKDGRLVIEPEEAKTVRFIFLAFIQGYNYDQIAAVLTQKKRSTLRGRQEWNGMMVANIMKNERRWGDLEARKSIVVDYKLGKVTKNNGNRCSAYVPEHHEAIVSPEIARAAHLVASSSKKCGVQDIVVIRQGALKGFVGIHPNWSGINAESIRSLCLSTYLPEEVMKLNDIAEMRAGATLGKALQSEYMTVSGTCFINQSSPVMTISKNGIRFSKACHSRLDDCEYVELLYHPILQVVILRKSNHGFSTAMHWRDDNDVHSVFSARAFSGLVFQTLNWKMNYRYQCRGICRGQGNAKFLIFELDESRILTGKNQYEQENCSMNLKCRLYRSKWVQSITVNDVMESGQVVENPMIGAIPSKNEVQRELDDLLMSM